MNKWIAVNDRLPTEPGRILIFIAGKIFIAEVWFYSTYVREEYFEISRRIFNDGEIKILQGKDGWLLPVHF